MFRKTVPILLIISFTSIVGAKKNCTDDDRIVGGYFERIQNVPYQVSIQHDGEHVCGGSLVTKTMVLTAAHCVSYLTPQDLPVLKIVLGTSIYAAGGVRIQVAKCLKHPKFNSTNMDYDVAVIKLVAPAPLTPSINTIVMADKVPIDGTRVLVSGWGYVFDDATKASPVLKAAEVRFISSNSCIQPPHVYSKNNIWPTMVCAGIAGKGVCSGDSGGPLVNRETKQLVGVISWGQTCGSEGHPGVFANVPLLKKWISRTIGVMSKTVL